MSAVFDVAVVGSGPGGAVTAWRLAEAGRSVVVLEEGPDTRTEGRPQFTMSQLEHWYRSGGLQAAIGTPAVAFAEGRCVGGGSEVNSGLYHRLPGEVAERWRAEFRVDGFHPDALDHHAEAVEAAVTIGTAGEVSPASQRLADGAGAQGWAAPATPRFMAASDAGVERQTMSRTLLPRAAAAGAEVRAGQRVARLRRRGGVWELVVDGAAPVRAHRVVVAAGAIQTPALLQRSGIRRHVGGSLAMHPMAKITAIFPDAVNHAGMGVGVHQMKEFGPSVQLGCSISSPGYLAMSLAELPAAREMIDSGWQNMATYYTSNASGRGRVLAVPGVRDPLVIFKVGRAGVGELLDGLRVLGRCLLDAGATGLVVSARGAGVLHSYDELDGFLATRTGGDLALMTVHLAGTTPMGEVAHAPVDSWGRVKGADGLYVNDASVLCGAPTVNPQGAIMAVAHRNAEHLLEEPDDG
ncbi:MAG TPA: GMC family oxidoreductase [Ilumatobacter sp.]|nr:GMC family oxidoreductase [Ilumatobacter sp.]